MIHITQWHTIDKIYLQILLCLCWINPFYWIIRNELWLQHEFIADSYAVKDGDMDSFARMLLTATNYKNFAPVINRFFQSSIKRRIHMLNEPSPSRPGIRYLVMIPLILTTLLFYSFSVEHSNRDVVQAKEPITVVLDAAHGGHDNGAIGVGGHAEKDLALRISMKLAALAEKYNIKVVSTRTEDLTLSLIDRIKESNRVQADLFISIHLNDNKADDPHANDYEVGVSRANINYKESVVMGSAIINRLRSSGLSTRITEKDGVLVLKRNDHPAMIIECGNMSDADNMRFLHDDARLEELCRNILSGIVDYSGRK
jgi:N-acetylmuramoyl-L-alanine amidase